MWLVVCLQVRPRNPEHPPSPAVSVLVPVLDEETHIRETVEAMRAQEFPGEVELLFADGGSADRTKAILEELAAEDPRIRVFDNPRRMTPSGLNVCLAHARGTYVARMDAHTYYPPRYLAAGVERLERGDTAWVSGPAIPRPTGRISRAVAVALGTWMGQGGSRKWQEAPDTGEVSGEEVELDTGVFAGVWRRDRVLASGGWDEAWPRNQDAEMAGRFLADGDRLICIPEMGAHYIPRNTLKGLAKQYWGYGYYRVATARRHPGSMRRSHVLGPGMVLTWPAAVVAPRPVRRLARLGLLVYLGGLASVAVGAWRRGQREEAPLLPAVLMAVQGGNGVGFLHGFVSFGLPWAALARIAGLRGLAERIGPSDRSRVWAPSLDPDA
jgi:glycosyltransferase involved in cell wall biosynthesis